MAWVTAGEVVADDTDSNPCGRATEHPVAVPLRQPWVTQELTRAVGVGGDR